MKKLVSIIMALLVSLVVVCTATATIHQVGESQILLTGKVWYGDAEKFDLITLSMVDHNKTDITILIDSPGGLADDMWTILADMDYLRKFYGVEWTTINIGDALSAGAFIWLNGDVRQGIKGCRFMFHQVAIYNAWGLVPWEFLPERWKQVCLDENKRMGIFIIERTGNVNWLIAFLNGGYGGANYFTTAELREIGMTITEL